MPRVLFDDREYETGPGETILDCLTRHGVPKRQTSRRCSAEPAAHQNRHLTGE